MNYFNSWWMPGVICLALLSLLAGASVAHLPISAGVSSVMLACLTASLVGLFCAAVWNLIKKRWGKGVVNLLMLPVCGVAGIVAMGFLMVASMFGPSEDGFADKLSIPADLVVTEPQAKLEAAPGGSKDAFQQSLLAALSSAGSDDPTITANVAALTALSKSNPGMLKRHLASSPSWRVFKEDGNVFATRRWAIGPEWTCTLHGYYTRHDVDLWSKAGVPDFQSRFTIGLSGRPWWRGNSETTRLKAGETAKVTLSKGNGQSESHCVIAAGPLAVEVMEQSGAVERRLTKASLGYVEKELAPLVERPTWETIRSILPAESIKRGKPSIGLRKSFQPGIYDSVIWVNPGEPGMVYLKAFEVTQGTALSSERLKDASDEWVGWSDDPEELFFSNTNFTIYEGDWGKPYAARFEVWFTPDSGGADRKLVEEVFKIEGWQR